MEHKLRVKSKVLLQAEGCGIILSVVRKTRAEPDQHPVDPSEHVGAVIHLGLENSDARHQNGSSLLVKGLCNSWITRRATQVTSNGSDSEMVLAGGVLVICEELNHSPLRTLLHRCWSTLICDLEVNAIARLGVNPAHLPSARVADAALGLADAARFLIEGDCMANETSDLELLGSEDLQRGIEAHQQVIIFVLVKDSDKRLFELGRGEAVSQDHVTACEVRQILHFQKTDLVQTASKDVDDVSIVRSALSKVVVELAGLVLM